MVALFVLTFSKLERVSSLEEAVAKALHKGKMVCLGDDDSGYIAVEFEQVTAGRIAQAREIVGSKKMKAFGMENMKDA